MGKTLASPSAVAIYALAAFWSVNLLAGRFGGYPFIYCWLSEPASALYVAWGTLTLYCLVAFVALNLYRSRMMDAVAGGLIMAGVIELPRLCFYLFYSGGSCG